MKKILIAIVFLLMKGCVAFGQNDEPDKMPSNITIVDTLMPIKFRLMSVSAIIVINSNSSIRMSLPDSSIRIEGDTAKILRYLLNYVITQDSIHRSDILAAVDFSNHIGAYYKNSKINCAYPKWDSVMVKNGYRNITVKSLPKCH